jgi:PleD family two-component response regulator
VPVEGAECELQISEPVGLLQQELSKPPSVPASEPVPASNSASSSLRLLVIDDDAALTERLFIEATAWNMLLDVAPDLRAARIAIAKNPPDIILLDLTFPTPTENGLTLLAELANQTPRFPLLPLRVGIA